MRFSPQIAGHFGFFVLYPFLSTPAES